MIMKHKTAKRQYLAPALQTFPLEVSGIIAESFKQNEGVWSPGPSDDPIFSSESIF